MTISLSNRIKNFSLIGMGVALLGIIEMTILVDFLSIEKNIAFMLQTVISLQLNFILNDVITYRTWRKLNGTLLRKWCKFHLSRTIAILFNQLLFSILTRLNIHYSIAYVICIGFISVYNFLTNDRFVFLTRQDSNISKKS